MILSIERPEEVVNLYLHQASFEFGTLSYPDFEDVRDGAAAVFRDGTTTATGSVCRSSGRSRGSGFYPGPHPTSESAPTLSEPAVPCERERHVAALPLRHARRRRHVGGRRHEPRLRRDPPLRGPSSPDSRAAVSRRLQRRACCHSPEHRRPPRPLTRFAGPVRSARARARGMSPPAASSARRAHSQSPAQALTRRRNASSVAQRRAPSSTAT